MRRSAKSVEKRTAKASASMTTANRTQVAFEPEDEPMKKLLPLLLLIPTCLLAVLA